MGKKHPFQRSEIYYLSHNVQGRISFQGTQHPFDSTICTYNAGITEHRVFNRQTVIPTDHLPFIKIRFIRKTPWINNNWMSAVQVSIVTLELNSVLIIYNS